MHLCNRVPYFSVGTNVLIHDELLGEHMSKVPFERVTLKLRSKGSTSFDIAKFFTLRTGENRREIRISGSAPLKDSLVDRVDASSTIV